jgi:phosphoglucosamine mutase
MDMARLFGTDGVRGKVNEYPMLPEVALQLGLAAGRCLANGKRRKAIIGKDTRLSGYVFETALTAGLCAAGVNVLLVGPMPTPAISFLVQSMRADLGIVVSASHNPYYDNGIKLFDGSGHKLADELEKRIEDMATGGEPFAYPAPGDVGKAQKIEDSRGRYIVSLKSTFPSHLTLDGLRIVLDCANGAAYKVAPLVFEELGATVIKLGVDPDGLNINEGCGALHPEGLAKRVVEEGAHIGLALDGDADRLIVCDEKGQVLDGDQIMALCAQNLMARDALPGGLLVATVMSNMALEVFMNEQGGQLLRTPVGDRHVAEALRHKGGVLGGEQSGHIIFSNFANTGDGTLAALQLLRIMVEAQRPLSELAGVLTPYPQRLTSIPVTRKPPFEEIDAVRVQLAEAERALSGKGRVLLRYSGTEPKARVMVEGQDEVLVVNLCERLSETIQQSLG